MNINFQFFYTCTNIGSEKILKDEISKKYPHLKLAYSQKGFLTFKNSAESLNQFVENPISSPWARISGSSFFKAKPLELLSELKKMAASIMKLSLKEKIILHEWAIGSATPTAFRNEISTFLPLKDGLFPEENDLILDLVTGNSSDVIVGLRRHCAYRSPFPGGLADFELPPAAPSRAYLKAKEAHHWTKARMEKGETLLELGSAPGGAAYYFLEQGLYVYGVDTGKMSEVCLQSPNYKHLPLSVQDLKPDLIPRNTNWLAVDLNQSPFFSLEYIEKITTRLGQSLKGLFFTVKFVDSYSPSDLSKCLKKLIALGFKDVHPFQLYHNRQEIFIYATSSSSNSALKSSSSSSAASDTGAGAGSGDLS